MNRAARNGFCPDNSFAASTVLLILVAFCLVSPQLVRSADFKSIKEIRPFSIKSRDARSSSIAVSVDSDIYHTFKNGAVKQLITVPVSITEQLTLELVRFEVVLPEAKFYIGSPSGNIPAPAPEVVMYRGKVRGDYNSHVYISFTSKGHSTGYISSKGVTHYIAHQSGYDFTTITTFEGGAELPPFAELCGVPDGVFTGLKSTIGQRTPTETPAGPIVAVLGLDADQRFYNIFGDLIDTENYLMQLLGAISDIYMRDFNMKLVTGFVRVWTAGGEPFDQNSLAGFAEYWNNNEDTSGLDIIHLITARRDLGFGGVAYLSSYCTDSRYSISGFMNGSFPTPFGEPSNSNWDVIVMAHELGHNFGTLHTHDNSQYDPLIDSCAFDFPSRGTIMSYCHIHPGYTANIEPRFPVRVQYVVETDVTNGLECFYHDCDGNGVDDAIDLLNETYPDVNSNNIPDVCEDCNGNSILDNIDIAGASDDENLNGIPDECEADCDGNGTPDSWETFFLNDINDNGVLDECEPDCNVNDTADFIEIADGRLDDFDRNNIPDICQDCNGNLIPDWIDLEREFNLFVADRNGGIREYHARSGYP
ncbi:MAG: M12 family metallo-peptidase, partial [Candidatus Zixiibacteriota bacterium]